MENKQATSAHSIIQKWVAVYSDDLYRWALHKTSDKETVQDLVQETFLAAFKSLDKFQGKSQPKTWLFSIMNNKIMGNKILNNKHDLPYLIAEIGINQTAIQISVVSEFPRLHNGKIDYKVIKNIK